MPSKTDLAAAVERMERTCDSFDCKSSRQGCQSNPEFIARFGRKEVSDIRTVLAALPQWKPIESAPRDRSVIVGGDDLSCQAHWHEDGGWYVANNDPTDAWGGPIYPTHWMELPEPPQHQQKIATIVSPFDVPVDEAEANGKLMKAAPQLLAALRELGAYLDFTEPWEDESCGFTDASGINAAFEKAIAAIAAATGEGE